MKKEATRKDNPVSYSGASLYIAIDMNNPRLAKVKLIDLGHPIRTDESFAVNGVTPEELHTAISGNHEGVMKGIEKLISIFNAQKFR